MSMLENIINEIQGGKTNSQIIEERLSELRNSNCETKYRLNTNIVDFHAGFISEELPIAADDRLNETFYIADCTELYDQLLNILREKGTITLKEITTLVYNFFELDSNSQYKELSKIFKEVFQNNRYAYREHLPRILNYYEHSNYSGDILDFGINYIYYNYGTEEKKNELKTQLEAFKSSIDWNTINSEDVRISLSKLKGTGCAACTERAMALHNCFCFLGTQSYMLGGNVIKPNNKQEGHNFVVIKNSRDEYVLLDASLFTKKKLSNISSKDDLLHLKDIEAISINGKKYKYYSF